LLVVFEDLHWIDNESQAVLDGLAETLPTARLLLLVNFRPEYLPRWTRKTYYTQVRIDPLTDESAEELLRSLLGTDPTLQPLARLLIERTEGNPLYLEESVRTLAETGELQGSRGAYRLTAPVTDIQVPATIQAILAARIDRLAPDDKHLLQAAAVIGKDVPHTLLQAIADGRPSCASIWIRCKPEFLYDRPFDLEYTFKHALPRSCASVGAAARGLTYTDRRWRPASERVDQPGARRAER
jgi:predicted ATPase